MRQYILYFLFSTFFIAGCNKENVSTSKSDGYLSVYRVEYEPKIVSKVVSRSVDETLTVELWKGGVKLRVLTPEEMSGKINLDVASDYSLKVYSSSYGSDSEWTNEIKGEPIYYVDVPFEIREGEVTGLKVKVPMINFGVSLDLSSIEGAPWLSEYSFSVTSGERSILLRNGETAYFTYGDGITFSYDLTVINIDGESNELNNIWGDSEEEKVNMNSIYTIYYDINTNSLNQK